jgi:hypothetical protein
MARPRKQPELRSSFLILRLTAEERKRVLERAAKAKQKPTTFVRVKLGLVP